MQFPIGVFCHKYNLSQHLVTRSLFISEKSYTGALFKTLCMKCVTLFTVPFFPVTSSRFSVTGGQLGFICTEGAGVEVYSSAVGGGRQEKLPPPNQCPAR